METQKLKNLLDSRTKLNIKDLNDVAVILLSSRDDAWMASSLLAQKQNRTIDRDFVLCNILKKTKFNEGNVNLLIKSFTGYKTKDVERILVPIILKYDNDSSFFALRCVL